MYRKSIYGFLAVAAVAGLATLSLASPPETPRPAPVPKHPLVVTPKPKPLPSPVKLLPWTIQNELPQLPDGKPQSSKPKPCPPPPPPPPVLAEHLDVFIWTGNDDVRAGSHVYAYAWVGGIQYVEDMNHGAAWPSGSGFVVGGPLALPQGTKLSDITDFGVTFTSGTSGIFDGPDNWDMQAVQVKISATQQIIVNDANAGNNPLSHDPLLRFKGGDPQQYWDTNVPSP